tara:strand:+ start:179 stop:763 length:585 start_codon:yes stop_codon:yes gene_type:complete
MKTEKVSIKKIRNNPKNPRVIKNAKFMKLVESIKEFPQMLDIRPIIVNKENIILGGNMRFRASIEAGLKEVTIARVNLTPEEEDEFIVKDNSNFGEWDWDVLANQFQLDELGDWGLDIPIYLTDDDEEPEFDEDIVDKRLESFLENNISFIRLHYARKQYDEVIKKLDKIMGTEENEGKSHSDFFADIVEKYKL